MPAASLSISVAGLVLAGSFGLLALVPVDALRQFAFVMALGVALDAFVVRPLLVPALITLFGRRGFWPSAPASAPAEEPATKSLHEAVQSAPGAGSAPGLTVRAQAARSSSTTTSSRRFIEICMPPSMPEAMWRVAVLLACVERR